MFNILAKANLKEVRGPYFTIHCFDSETGEKFVNASTEYELTIEPVYECTQGFYAAIHGSLENVKRFCHFASLDSLENPYFKLSEDMNLRIPQNLVKYLNPLRVYCAKNLNAKGPYFLEGYLEHRVDEDGNLSTETMMEQMVVNLFKSRNIEVDIIKRNVPDLSHTLVRLHGEKEELLKLATVKGDLIPYSKETPFSNPDIIDYAATNFCSEDDIANGVFRKEALESLVESYSAYEEDND